MEMIGLQRDEQGDFAHPKLDVNSVLSLYALYRLTRGKFWKPTPFSDDEPYRCVPMLPNGIVLFLMENPNFEHLLQIH
jgi:hypothetical protein